MAHRVPFTANKTIKLAERGVSHDYIPSAQACVSASTNGVFRGGHWVTPPSQNPTYAAGMNSRTYGRLKLSRVRSRKLSERG